MTRINTNVASLVGRTNLQRSNASLAQSLTRLSTGLRINTGKDDPAGLIASENLRSDITAIKKAISNTDRANQVIATADSALGQVSSLLNDIRGLVTESANAGALSEEQIAANQLQVDSSLEALNRIAQTTTFQGRRLLDGSLDFLTTQGANSSNINALQIDQANLGASGQVGVDVNVTAAATQATVEVNNLPDVTPPAQGTVTFSTETTAAQGSTGSVDFDIITADTVQATGGINLTTQAEGTVTLAGETLRVNVDSGFLAGTAGNGAITNIAVNVSETVAGGNSVGVDYNDTANTLTLNFAAASVTATDVVNALNGTLAGGVDYANSTDTIAADDLVATITGGSSVAISSDSPTNAITLSGGAAATDLITLTAVEDGALDGVAANGAYTDISVTYGNGSESVVDAGSGVLQVNLTQNEDVATVANIVSAIDNATAIGLDAATGSPGTLARQLDFTGAGEITLGSGGFTAGADAVTTTESIYITGTLAAGANGDIDISFAEAALGSGGASTNVIGNSSTGYTVQINTDIGVGVDIDDIRAAIESIDEVATASFDNPATTGTTETSSGSFYNSIQTNGTGANAPEAPPSQISLANGVDQVITAQDINITTAVGFLGNLSIGFAEANLSGTPTNVTGDATNGYTIQIDNTGTVTLEEIRSAIESLAEVGSATFENTGAGSQTYDATNDTPPTPPTLLTGAGNGNGVNGIDQDLVFQLSGATGSEVLTFEANTSLELLVNGINAVSDATGVTAEANGTSDGLILSSSAYGSNAFVDLQIIEEGSSGAFTTELGQGDRQVGTDIVASVNGITANGKGNDLSINTATLDLSATITAGFEGTASFEITGGGALFQLGPDVVSNQQARLGVNSVNTAALGGTSGLLYQLGSGGTADLSTDSTTAASIVEEAINQVTSLRGRLGAFQRTTLETNKNALNDTLSNLTEAESSIRDADFAAETANLTRSQILVQSGTRVLAIANQNPQNVLGLLG
ncbi:A-type flagellin [Posidoniimonas corsicana]|uniref:Flagellin n=1 Tax=Posidoniimonas corsicana TaxID=1938618 RepID=A0A5C5VJ53_9BACT|nr:flagellin [Posidoniimonas corsicana]TWT37919.1 A-type flagellin [Posidoniimonas corsicana]